MSATKIPAIKRVADFNLEGLGVCEEGREIMSAKAALFFFEISNLEWHALEIIKQEALSVGGDFATPRGAIKRVGERKGVLVATRSQLCRIVEKLSLQPFGLKAIAEHLRTHLDGELPASRHCEPLQRNGVAINNIEPKATHESVGRIPQVDCHATHPADAPLAMTEKKSSLRASERSERSVAINSTTEGDALESPTIRHCEARAQRATKQSHYLETEKKSSLRAVSEANGVAINSTTEGDALESPTHRHCETPRSGVVAINSTTEGDALESRTDSTSGLPRVCYADARNDDSGLTTPQIMAIINVESDSFFEEFSVKSAIDAVREMLDSGVAFIDIGAASSAPGKPRVESSTEISRLKHLCEQIKREKLYEKARFSIDSYNLETSRFALEHGFSVVNDVSGLADIKLAEMARDYGADYILMATHAGWLDAPDSNAAQNLADKNADIILELDKFFSQKIAELEAKNVKKIIIDPGFGFAKTHAQNLEIVKNLAHFKRFKRPILMGLSNKKSTEAIAKNRAVSTLVLNTIAAQNGADILRVHDWAAHLAALKTLAATK